MISPTVNISGSLSATGGTGGFGNDAGGGGGGGGRIKIYYTDSVSVAGYNVGSGAGGSGNNANGQAGSTGTYQTLQTDVDPPVIAINTPANQWYSSNPLLDIDFSDEHSLVENCYYQIDSWSGVWKNLTSDGSAVTGENAGENFENDWYVSTVDWDALSYDSHVIYFKCVDNWGNVNGGSDPSLVFIKNGPPNQPAAPYCENQTDPTQVTTLTPNFNAVFTDNDLGDNALYVQVQVGTTAGGSDMWDSGIVSVTDQSGSTLENNERSTDITYDGLTLSRGVTYHWQIRFQDNSGVNGAWSDDQTFKLATPAITQIVVSADEIDRDVDQTGSGAIDNLIVYITVQDNFGRDWIENCYIWIRDNTDSALVDNAQLSSYENIDENTKRWSYSYNPPDGTQVGFFDARAVVVGIDGVDNLKDYASLGYELFFVDDVVISISIDDNAPTYQVGVLGSVSRVSGAAASADNVRVVDNNQGTLTPDSFTDTTYNDNYELISPVRLHHDDQGTVYVWARDDTLDGVSSTFAYEVQGDNAMISDISVSPSKIIFRIEWKSDQTNANGTAYLDDDSGIQGPVTDGNGWIDRSYIMPGSHTLNFFDNADRPLWEAYSTSFYLPSTVRVENLKTNGLTNPTHVITSHPTFSWDYFDETEKPQTSYQVWIGIATGSYDTWDSGQVDSDNSSCVYAGSELTHGRTYYAQVRVHNSVEWSAWTQGAFTMNVPPVASGLEIETVSGSGYVGSENVSLTLAASDSDGTVTHMTFSLDNETWSAWQAWATTATYLIASTEGVEQTVYFMVRDDSEENSNVLSATVTLDKTPPTGLELVSPGENAAIGPAVVTLDWTPARDNVSGVVAYYRLEWSSDPDLSSAVVDNWTVYTYWSVPYENYRGDYYWRVRVRDRVGNENTTPIRRYAYSPDAPPVTMAPVPDYLNTTSLTLELEGTNVENLRYSIGSETDLDLAGWENFVTALHINLPAQEGSQAVYLEFRSPAGVVAGPLSARFVVDYSPPLLQVSPSMHWTRENWAELEVVGLDEVTGIELMKVWLENEHANWEDFTAGASVRVNLPTIENDYTVRVKLRDLAGNESAVKSAVVKIRYAVDAPVGLDVPEKLEGNYLTLTGIVEPEVEVWVNGVEIEVRADGSFSVRTELSSGMNNVKILLRDPAGNEWTQTFAVEGMVSASGLPISALPLGILAVGIGSGVFYFAIVRKYRQATKPPKEILAQAPLPHKKTPKRARSKRVKPVDKEVEPKRVEPVDKEGERSYRKWLDEKRREKGKRDKE